MQNDPLSKKSFIDAPPSDRQPSSKQPPLNPFKAPILSFLSNCPPPVSEHALIMTLKHDFKRFDELALPTDDHNLALFRVHFLVMNALYDIKNDLQDGFELYISPLAIFLKQNGEPVLSGGKQALQEQDDNQANADTLSEYYLKWDNLTQADSAEIDKLLSGFWQRYLAFDRKTEALKMLNLPLGANWPLVKKTYRSLANKHHPDKGGSAQRFIEMREAYEILRACLLN